MSRKDKQPVGWDVYAIVLVALAAFVLVILAFRLAL